MFHPLVFQYCFSLGVLQLFYEISLQMENFIYGSIWQDYSEPKEFCNRVLASTVCLSKKAVPIVFIDHCSQTPPGRRIFMSFLDVVKGTRIQTVYIAWFSFWQQKLEHQTNKEKKSLHLLMSDIHLKSFTQSVAYHISLVTRLLLLISLYLNHRIAKSF